MGKNGAELFRHLWRKITILSLHRCKTIHTYIEEQVEGNGTEHIRYLRRKMTILKLNFLCLSNQ